MTDAPDNLVLNLWREIRASHDKLRDTLAEVVTGLGRVDTRLDRIETRLGLVDA